MSYDAVWKKYERAGEHIKNLWLAVEAFREANRDKVGTKTDEQSGDVVHYLKSVPIVPVEIRLILGDAIHNLHSSLDYLAHAIVRPVGTKAVRDTKFPIGDTAEGFSAELPRCVKGAREYCLQTFRRIEPYRGGNGHPLWQLHKLDIVDKHRLPLTAVYNPMGRTMTPQEREKFDTSFSRISQDPLLKFLSVPSGMVGASAPELPLKEGQILATLPAADAKHEMRFAFGVALDEPAISEAVDIVYLAEFLSSEVRRVINDLGGCATIR